MNSKQHTEKGIYLNLFYFDLVILRVYLVLSKDELPLYY